MISIPHKCPRGRSDCIALSNIISDDKSSFFCCGENDGENLEVPQDKYRVCFKGPHDDRMSNNDKLDLVHNAAVLSQALAVIQAAVGGNDWSPWDDDPLNNEE